MDHSTVERWVADYERAWRTPGTAVLTELFSAGASYQPWPWARPRRGLGEIGPWWDDERDGPDEAFTMTSEVVAVDRSTAVVRVEVHYLGGREPSRWRDLWVIRFDADGRCASFEEWPFAPGRQPEAG